VCKYDNESLLTAGFDARGVKTTFSYDGLSRVESVSYTGESGYATPNVNYTYDEIHASFYNKGCLTKVQTAANATQGTPETIQNYDYDKVGQVVNHTQSIGNQSYNLTYGYNLAGQLVSEKYPSGKVFNYSVDDYGRLQTVADNQRTYLSSVSFTNQGLLNQMNLGNGTSESFGYNDRFQMTSQNLNKGSQVMQKYDYGYGKVDLATGSIDVMKNNGQLGKITSFIGTTQQSEQRFDYDSIGRLSEAREYRGATNTLTYKEHFDFDRFGNLYRKAANNSTAGQANPLAYTPIEDNQIEKSTNRFTSATGTTYNEAGMVVGDNKFRSMNFAYDANGRQVKATKANTSDAWSVYDALGNRVGTKVNDVWQFVIYDAFGKLVAEYGTQGEGNGGVSYVLQDWQGSVRASVNNNGFIQARFDFSAFGEEINLNVGLRSIEQGYSGDATTRQGYGLTEKDSSGLNHTWFRKQEQRAGRWTSPDPYKGSMSLGNPQSFNRYSYVGNEPIVFVDPSGLFLSFYCIDYEHWDPRTATLTWRRECQIVDDGRGGTIVGSVPIQIDSLGGIINDQNNVNNALKDYFELFSERLKKCLDSTLGADSKHIRSLNPTVNTGLDSKGIGNQYGQAPSAGRGILTNGKAVIYAAKDYLTATRPDGQAQSPIWFLFDTITHELGNLTSADVTSRIFGKKEYSRYGNPNGIGQAKDTDTGAKVELCLNGSVDY
jgi:RHS repeat-associated protein